MRLCSYTMVHDYGFAPNPFWGFCTLGVCTPNHQGIKLAKGDWILGNSDVKSRNLLIYAMCVSESLNFDAYFHDQRFKKKKPRFDRGWKEASGDNIYYRGTSGRFRQIQTQYHADKQIRKKDEKHPTVFIAKEFYYFGRSMFRLPAKFQPLMRVGKGCRCNHDPKLVEEFIAWLRNNFTKGIHGDPRDADTSDVYSERSTC